MVVRPRMGSVSKDASLPITSADDLLLPMLEAEKPASEFKVGTESEKTGVLDGVQAVSYDEIVRPVLERLRDRFGYHETPEVEGGPLIALRRDGLSVTLEPAGQLELSGAPLKTIHETCAENTAHMKEVESASEGLGVRWLGTGYHPFASQAELSWVPKMRYSVMREYLPTKGSRALDMMRRTGTVQANVDFSDVEDAFAKLRVGLKLGPIVAAMFANSPWVERKRGDHLSERSAVWLDMDNERSGVLPVLWEGTPSYERYVEWALDVPMFLFIRDGALVRNTGQTFRDFLANGYEGHRATRGDWETHLNTLFPEARLKRTIEFRGADGQRNDLVCALPALWRGLLYEADALKKAQELASKISPEGLIAARNAIPSAALRASLEGRDVAEWASEVLSIAEGGLERLGEKNDNGEDERIFLAPLRALVSKGWCPAEAAIEAAPGDKPDAEAVIDHLRVA